MLSAVYDFVTTYTDAPPASVYRGYQNRTALPADNSYVIIAVESSQRVGTNVLDIGPAENGQIASIVLREYAVTVDFIGLDQGAVQDAANTLENIGRSYIAVDFFQQYNIGFNFVDDTEYLPFTDETDQQLHRYRVTLHFTRWETVTVSQQYAEQVAFSRVENIDAHHPAQ